MRGVVRILNKELFELLESWRGIALVLVLPLVLLFLVGQLQSQTLKLRLLVVSEQLATEDTTLPDEPRTRAVFSLLEEIAALEIMRVSQPVVDPLQAMRAGRYDLLLDMTCSRGNNCPSHEGWSLYTAETDRWRLAVLEKLVLSIEHALSSAASQPSAARSADGVDTLVKRLNALGTFPSRTLKTYYPQASERSLYLLPMTIALMVCFLPFALSAVTLISESEARTLEILLAAPGISPMAVLVGKFLWAILVTLLQLLLMLVLSQTVYGLHVKSGLFEIGIMVLPGIAASAWLGLAVSASAASQSQAMLAAAIYFLALTMLSGFLFPVAEASWVIQRLSNLLPLTFVHPVLQAWMFGDSPLTRMPDNIGWLLTQLTGYGALTAVVYRRLLRRM